MKWLDACDAAGMTRGASDYNKIKIKRILGQYLYSRQDAAGMMVARPCASE